MDRISRPSSDDEDYAKEEIDYDYLDRETPPESPQSESDNEELTRNEDDDEDMDWPPPEDIDEGANFR